MCRNDWYKNQTNSHEYSNNRNKLKTINLIVNEETNADEWEGEYIYTYIIQLEREKERRREKEGGYKKKEAKVILQKEKSVCEISSWTYLGLNIHTNHICDAY